MIDTSVPMFPVGGTVTDGREKWMVGAVKLFGHENPLMVERYYFLTQPRHVFMVDSYTAHRVYTQVTP